MNASRSYRSSYDQSEVREIQRRKEDRLAAAAVRKVKMVAYRAKYEQARQARGALDRGMDRRMGVKRGRPVIQRLPFYPPVKQVIYTFAPIPPGAFAFAMAWAPTRTDGISA